MLIGDDHDFFKLVKRYAIWPPDNVDGVRGKLLETFDPSANADIRLGGSTTHKIELRRVEGRRAYINLRLNPRGVAGAGREGNTITFDSTYTTTTNYVPVYVLPWIDHGGSVRVTIPGPTANRGPSTALNPADPYIFFTAAINGCSITYRRFYKSPIKHAQGFHYKDSSVARPLIYREIWPNGPGHVTVKAGLPSIL